MDVLMVARKQQRISALLEQVASKGMLNLKKAADQLQVSEMTIRRDIASSGGRLSALGGYILGPQTPMSPYTLEQETDANQTAKNRACDWACSLIENEDTLFLDCGTTMPYLAARLPEDFNLTVVCYALNVAQILARKSGVRMVLMGGLYHATSASFEGDSNLAWKSIRLNKAFISAGGVHPSRGVSCSNFHEVPIKRAAIDSALSSFLVVDRSKLGKLKPAYFAEQAEFEAIISETGISRAGRLSMIA